MILSLTPALSLSLAHKLLNTTMPLNRRRLWKIYYSLKKSFKLAPPASSSSSSLAAEEEKAVFVSGWSTTTDWTEQRERQRESKKYLIKKLVEIWFFCQLSRLELKCYIAAVWPDWAIYWTLGNFLRPLATINLPKSPTFLGNFCKGDKIYNFSSEIIFGQLL